VFENTSEFIEFIEPLRQPCDFIDGRMNRTPQDIQNELLVYDCQEGNPESLKHLVQRWHPRFLSWAFRIIADRGASADVVQDAWLAIVRGLHRLDDPARFPAWAYRIVAHKCADWTRNQAQRRRGPLPDESRGPTAPADHAAARIRLALRTIPDEHRAILALHYLDGLGIQDIARIMRVPAGTVKSRLFHARARLRASLERTDHE
jgi:RNA polymerase sigma-70 factor (ECF subfamily)